MLNHKKKKKKKKKKTKNIKSAYVSRFMSYIFFFITFFACSVEISAILNYHKGVKISPCMRHVIYFVFIYLFYLLISLFIATISVDF